LYGATFYNVAGLDGDFITEMFVNGVGTGSPSPIRPATFSVETPTTLLLGTDAGGSIYGEIAHYAFFEGELSDAQMLELATKTPDSITGASPKVYYPLLSDTLNHGSGGATYDLTLISGATLSSTNDATIPVSSSPDTAAPTLTSPSATATGATTASGSVTTNEANGTLYYLASANATETDVTVKAGSSQAVTQSATPQSVSFTGLTAATPYYPHYLHRDAAGNDSAVASGAQFTTAAANTSPSFTGPNIADISGTEAVALTPVDVSSLFFDSESGLTFSAIGSWPAGVTVSSAGVISGTPTTAGTYASLQVRATDAGSLTADSNAFTITVAAPAVAGINVTEPLKNNTGTVLASQSGVRAAVLQAADLVSVYETSGLTTDASGLLAAISDAAITTGQQYHVAIKLADGSVGITGPITAS
jgi:hypothetical protein